MKLPDSMGKLVTIVLSVMLAIFVLFVVATGIYRLFK